MACKTVSSCCKSPFIAIQSMLIEVFLVGSCEEAIRIFKDKDDHKLELRPVKGCCEGVAAVGGFGVTNRTRGGGWLRSLNHQNKLGPRILPTYPPPVGAGGEVNAGKTPLLLFLLPPWLRPSPNKSICEKCSSHSHWVIILQRTLLGGNSPAEEMLMSSRKRMSLLNIGEIRHRVNVLSISLSRVYTAVFNVYRTITAEAPHLSIKEGGIRSVLERRRERSESDRVRFGDDDPRIARRRSSQRLIVRPRNDVAAVAGTSARSFPPPVSGRGRVRGGSSQSVFGVTAATKSIESAIVDMALARGGNLRLVCCPAAGDAVAADEFGRLREAGVSIDGRRGFGEIC
nr:hypothetical protein Iba_chr07fCG11510 [Ipomoea batatas]